MEHQLSRYFRSPEQFNGLIVEETGSSSSGYFRLGKEIALFGRLASRPPSRRPVEDLYDAAEDIRTAGGSVHLPFSLGEVVDNLQREVYVEEWRQGNLSILSKPYYFIRPLLSVGVRRHLQKFYLQDWNKLSFPRWPVDCTIDNLMEQLLLLILQATGADKIPFIWFWPDQYKGCALMTHDVETEVGRKFCQTLMDIDDSFGIKASFQIVPEERYCVTAEFLDTIRERCHELAIHDLNHDGHLYECRKQFVERAQKINAYGKRYKTDGFRAAVLYRKQLWYDELKFAYDMSVPNVAHLDPQRGGCCTVMPYFIGDILELPVTTIQDYTLFNILNDFSTEIWRRQTEIIAGKFGLMSFVIHPDYVIKGRQRAVYEDLLRHLVELREKESIWITTPSELNRWWRQRAEMRLVATPKGWKIENAADDRARVAYAYLDGDHLAYEVETSPLLDMAATARSSSEIHETPRFVRTVQA